MKTTYEGSHARWAVVDSCLKPGHGIGLSKCRICHNADLFGRYTPKHRKNVPANVGY